MLLVIIFRLNTQKENVDFTSSTSSEVSPNTLTILNE